jgi:hypothetical protein
MVGFLERWGWWRQAAGRDVAVPLVRGGRRRDAGRIGDALTAESLGAAGRG